MGAPACIAYARPVSLSQPWLVRFKILQSENAGSAALLRVKSVAMLRRQTIACSPSPGLRNTREFGFPSLTTLATMGPEASAAPELR